MGLFSRKPAPTPEMELGLHIVMETFGTIIRTLVEIRDQLIAIRVAVEKQALK